MEAKTKRKKREYLQVTTQIDKTGYMQPKEIIWKDGRRFQIDRISDFGPANTTVGLSDIDCYTIHIHGQQQSLYFERLDPVFAGRFGRWYVYVGVPQ